MIRTLLAILIFSILVLVPDEASAQLETLVMPGDVITGHAELEADCDNCHKSFERSKQRELCLDCHDDIASDMTNGKGYHGLNRRANGRNCAGCHTDHEGRDARIVILDESTFDHELTDFLLHGKHAGTACNECHQPGNKHREAPLDCHSCHQEDSVHEDAMGEECESCHSPTAWSEVEFDHESTGYALLGKHGQAGCLDCHADQTFQPAPVACIDCHAQDDAHDGRSGSECGNCHSPTGWQDTSFNHARDTRFMLDGSHSKLSCSDCHSEDPFADKLETACVACHQDDDNHDGHFGGNCDTCHAATEWADSIFDHARDAGHELLGGHATTDCTSCHVEPIFDVALQTGCNSCHASDDPHVGTQGEACTDCHNESGWADSVFFDHGLTSFPLLGSHDEKECDACHVSKVFKDAPTNCVACHDDDDPHGGNLGDDCGVCHNPVDWASWRFEHDVQTSFALLGAHVEVTCDACHRRPLQQQLRLGNRCADCHRPDDIHDGEFGADCGRCHSADSFTNVRSIR